MEMLMTVTSIKTTELGENIPYVVLWLFLNCKILIFSMEHHQQKRISTLLASAKYQKNEVERLTC